MSARVPPGYVAVAAGDAHAVALEPLAGVVRAVLREGRLHDWAARHPDRRELRGRAPAYAVPLPDGATRVVVRHAWHGGALRHVTGDRFLAPTRAPRELAIALRLAAAGVPTPEIVAYATYPAGPLLRRSDVASREVPDARDLALVLVEARDAAERTAALVAAARLLAQLARAGARHADLNVKNVLLSTAADGTLTAWAIDVDRVTFHPGDDDAVLAANHARLARSARKWRAPPNGSLLANSPHRKRAAPKRRCSP